MITNSPAKRSLDESQIPNIAPVPLRYLTMVLEARGYDPQAVFPPNIKNYRELLSGNTRISFELGHTIIRNAVKLTRDPNLGLAVAARKSFTAGGLLSLALLASRNGIEAIYTGMEFDLEGGNMMILQADERPPDEFEMTAIAKFRDHTTLRFLTDDLVASVAGFARGISRNEKIVIGAEFSYDPGKSRVDYERYFKCPIRFNGTKNSVTLDYRIMKEPLRTADPYVLAEIKSILQEKARRLSGRDAFLSSVENEIRRNLREHPDQKHIASELAISERSLRRKLAEHNTTFRELLTNVRQTRAFELINLTNRSIDDIAVDLGFSDCRTFRQAFKNWTGESPTQLRKLSAKESVIDDIGSKADQAGSK